MEKNFQQKTSPKSYKMQIKILANTGLASSGTMKKMAFFLSKPLPIIIIKGSFELPHGMR